MLGALLAASDKKDGIGRHERHFEGRLRATRHAKNA